MPTSDERREVAARLRALPLDTYAAIREWEKDGLFIDASLSDEADYSQIHNAVLGCFPAEYMNPGDHEELHDRLADLIDPTCEMDDAGDVPASVKDNLNTFFCSECGAPVYNDMSPSYCPYCGCRVTVVR